MPSGPSCYGGSSRFGSGSNSKRISWLQRALIYRQSGLWIYLQRLSRQQLTNLTCSLRNSKKLAASHSSRWNEWSKNKLFNACKFHVITLLEAPLRGVSARGTFQQIEWKSWFCFRLIVLRVNNHQFKRTITIDRKVCDIHNVYCKCYVFLRCGSQEVPKNDNN